MCDRATHTLGPICKWPCICDTHCVYIKYSNYCDALLERFT